MKESQVLFNVSNIQNEVAQAKALWALHHDMNHLNIAIEVQISQDIGSLESNDSNDLIIRQGQGEQKMPPQERRTNDVLVEFERRGPVDQNQGETTAAQQQ